MAKAKSKSTVNKAGNYTKPGMRKKIFNRIKAVFSWNWCRTMECQKGSSIGKGL